VLASPAATAGISLAHFSSEFFVSGGEFDQCADFGRRGRKLVDLWIVDFVGFCRIFGFVDFFGDFILKIGQFFRQIFYNEFMPMFCRF
jgi:hypothetical protein